LRPRPAAAAPVRRPEAPRPIAGNSPPASFAAGAILTMLDSTMMPEAHEEGGAMTIVSAVVVAAEASDPWWSAGLGFASGS
jgi:hypothetical protein